MPKHYLVLALGVVSVSFAAVFIRLAEAPPLVIAAYRLGLASLVVVPAAWIRSPGEIHRLSGQDVLLALLSGFFLALHFGLWIASLSYTTVASSVVLVTANPIFVAVASRFLFHEKLGRQTIAGIIVCLFGAALIGYGDWRLGSRELLGDALAFLGALAVAGYLLIGHRLRRTTGLLTYASLVYVSAAVVLLLATLLSGHRLAGYSPTTYLMLLLLAVVPQLMGHLSLLWALRFVPATLVAVAVLGEPVGATVLAFLVLHEAPSPTTVIGGIVLLAGIFVAFRRAMPGPA
ncbi:MAG: DMT family transporter [Chloroflexota bacterium]